jgi:hypothetical protein
MDDREGWKTRRAYWFYVASVEGVHKFDLKIRYFVAGRGSSMDQQPLQFDNLDFQDLG